MFFLRRTKDAHAETESSNLEPINDGSESDSNDNEIVSQVDENKLICYDNISKQLLSKETNKNSCFS